MQIPLYRWLKLMYDLKNSSQNIRESGAFLLGREDRIIDHILYNQLDPNVADSGIIMFNGKYFIELWKYCAIEHLKVLADIHTHPGNWTEMSETDRTNPMISQIGHYALIVPNYANKTFPTLKGVGMFRYEGNHIWKKTKNIKLSIL